MNLTVGRRVLIALSIWLIHLAKIDGGNPQPTSRWIGQLSNSNAAEADQAVLKIFQDGNDSLAGLMNLLDDERPFAGQLLFWDKSSGMRATPTQGYAAMYLIHAVLRKRLFETTVPRLARTNNSPQTSIESLPAMTPGGKGAITRTSSLKLADDDLLQAKAAYRAWWNKRSAGYTGNMKPTGGHGSGVALKKTDNGASATTDTRSVRHAPRFPCPSG